MTIAIVILNWNGRALLEQFLPSVLLHSAQATIYLADNASTDDSVAFVQERYPAIRIVQNTENLGYAGGYNAALQHIQADVYCLLNSDVAVTEGWLRPIIKAFANDETLAIAQPKLLDFKQPEKFEYAGAAGGYIDKYGYPYCRGRQFNTLEEDKGQYDAPQPVPVFWASGACFFIRAKVFHQLRGFDEAFFAHQEEIDLCWRAHREGLKVACVTQSTVYHLGGATLATNNPKKTYLNFRNSLLMLLKNLPDKGLYTTLFLRLVLDGVAGVRFLLQGKPRLTYEIVRAHFAFYKHFAAFKQKRPKTITFKDYFQRKFFLFNR